ncbi:mammalian cell entry protein [Mycolicibacterium lutetiense]|jgi:Mce-associated membrane protein|uniref:Mce-associated membrane protein n=1 Tax=Mycolicibacterium lutetiense TaxID=1641992 RepID=A0ABS4ZZT4_9MYCO|nr:mammalian cell entry protein [Mycolicibacterium lutetiense]MBP2455022.1 Mce-associated membrane protein [Mycolicibacterium lutetiense]
MSPRRKISADERDYFAVEPKEPISWGLPIVGMLSALLIAAAIAGCTFMLVRHESDERTNARDADALAYVTEFMKGYMTRDPFHANDFADDVLRQATGDFAKMFKEKQDEITVRVAQAEPSEGSVQEAGIQRWNDNGSADVLVATKTSIRAPDGKSTIETGDRWIATTIREGQQWKISQLIQVF